MAKRNRFEDSETPVEITSTETVEVKDTEVTEVNDTKDDSAQTIKSVGKSVEEMTDAELNKFMKERRAAVAEKVAIKGANIPLHQLIRMSVKIPKVSDSEAQLQGQLSYLKRKVDNLSNKG
jgi:hypothetical protein